MIDMKFRCISVYKYRYSYYLINIDPTTLHSSMLTPNIKVHSIVYPGVRKFSNPFPVFVSTNKANIKISTIFPISST